MSRSHPRNNKKEVSYQERRIVCLVVRFTGAKHTKRDQLHTSNLVIHSQPFDLFDRHDLHLRSLLDATILNPNASANSSHI